MKHRISKDERRHDYHLTELYNHPQKHFGLGLDFLVMKEARFIHKKDVVAEPDLTIFLPYKKLILLVEYKDNDTPKSRRKAKYQLSSEETLLKAYFREYRIHNYYVYQNYEVIRWDDD